MEIETKRLVLASPKPGDGAALLPIRNSSYVLERNAAPALPLEKLEQQLAQELLPTAPSCCGNGTPAPWWARSGWRPTGFATRCPPTSWNITWEKIFPGKAT